MADNISNIPPNVQHVRDIADAMDHIPPIKLTVEWMRACERAAAVLGKLTVGSTAPKLVIKNLDASAIAENPFGSPNSPWYSELLALGNQADQQILDTAMKARVMVFEVINEVNAFVARAKNAGFSPPDNPFAFIAQRNLKRDGAVPVPITPAECDDVMFNVGAYLDLLKAEKNGTISFDKTLNSTTQLSSANFSLDGYGGSGNTAADLMRFLPDADAIKQAKAAEALSVLDFKKRVPKVLFTANYAPDGNSKGCIIGWKKIPDASGYVIRRRNIFDGTETGYTLTNVQAQDRYEQVKDYVKTWVLSFYDDVDPNGIFCMLDTTIGAHSFYAYRVQAFQIHSEKQGTLFTIDTVPANLSVVQRNEIRRQIEKIDPGEGQDTVSPYPFLARQLLGDDQLDWLLAGVNIRKSVQRNDSKTQTRSYSYLSAQLNFLFDMMDQGKFVVPKDPSQIVKKVNDAITKYGVTQVMQELLSETGILYFFEGKDVQEDTHFDRLGKDSLDPGSLFSTVAAAIDPETATLNLKVFSTNLPQALAGAIVGKDGLLKGTVNSKPEEIQIDVNANNITQSASEDQIQFLQEVDLRDGVLDLTTFEGLSKFLRALRIFSDFGPNRGAPADAEVIAQEPPGKQFLL